MKILSFADLHAPFLKRGFLSWVKELADWYQPDEVVIPGDLTDNHALGRWPKHPDADNIWTENSLAQEQLAELYTAFPDKVKLIMGNHDDRLKKRLYEIGIPDQFCPAYRELFSIPESWEIYEDSYEVDGVLYYHGHKKGGVTPALALAKVIGQSVVCGHHHGTAGVHRINPNGNPLWGMDLGCGVDIKSYGMYYAKETLMQPILGCGTVEDGLYPKHYVMGE